MRGRLQMGRLFARLALLDVSNQPGLQVAIKERQSTQSWRPTDELLVYEKR